MKSSLSNMVLSLFGITVVCALMVGGAYLITKEPIEQARNRNQKGALLSVLPQFDNDPSRERRFVNRDGIEAAVYFARSRGDVIGIAVETSAPGYSGAVRLIVGFEMSGVITNIVVTEHTETPGLGDVIAAPENPVKMSIVGRNASEMRLSLRRDGGDVDGVTAATVSSRAYANAVRRAYEVFRLVATLSPDELEELFSTGAAPGETSGSGARADSDSATGATVGTDGDSGATVKTDGNTGATKKNTPTDSDSGATTQNDGDAPTMKTDPDSSTGATKKNTAEDGATGATLKTDSATGATLKEGGAGR